MKSKMLMVGLIVGLMLFASIASVVRADEENDKEDGRPEWHDDDHENKWVLENGKISVWFQEKKPMLKIFKTGEDGNVSGYKVKIKEIFERDVSGDEVASIDLEEARPSDWIIKTENETNGIKISMNANLDQHDEDGGMADVTLIFHINTTSAEVKFDLLVNNWVWQSEDKNNATLALKMKVETEEVDEEKEGEENENEEGDHEDKATVGAEGYIKWATTAVADGKTINVTSDLGKDNEDDEGETHITLIFNNSGGCTSLQYDPTFGVYGGTSWITVAGIGIAAVVAIVAVAVLLRKKK